MLRGSEGRQPPPPGAPEAFRGFFFWGGGGGGGGPPGGGARGGGGGGVGGVPLAWGQEVAGVAALVCRAEGAACRLRLLSHSDSLMRVLGGDVAGALWGASGEGGGGGGEGGRERE